MITVVVGPCCAGKSTYVEAKRAHCDVVIDVDALCGALGARDPRRPDPMQRTAAVKARDALVAYAASGLDVDVWLIHSRPSTAVLSAYTGRGWPVVVVDPGREECMRRATADGRPAWTREAIATWYEDPPRVQDAEVSAAPASREW